MDEALAAKLSLAMFVLNGGSVAARLCEREPMDGEDLDELTIGTGTYNARGGLFTCHRRGWVECVVVKWHGRFVVTRPSYLPMFARVGDQAKCGPFKIESEGGSDAREHGTDRQ